MHLIHVVIILLLVLVSNVHCTSDMNTSNLTKNHVNNASEENIDFESSAKKTEREATAYSCAAGTWHTETKELFNLLEDDQLFGLIPDEGEPDVPKIMPNHCHQSNEPQNSRHQINMIASCPWNYDVFDQGPGFHPRKVVQAHCLCRHCTDTDVADCLHQRDQMTVHKEIACKDGMAILDKRSLSYLVGCYCAFPSYLPNDYYPAHLR